MSLAKKLNFIKGWPNPHILEHSGPPAAGVTVDEALIAHRNSAGAWVLGISDRTQLPFVLWNGAAGDGDQGVAFSKTASSQQVRYGGVQGIALSNPIEFQTAQYAGTPVFGDGLYADTDGVLKVCTGSATVASKIVVAYVSKGVTASPTANVNMITVVPDNSRQVSS